MLKKFTVSNYRSFENPITLDFTNVRDYDFNEECIKDGLINKAVIYGENAVGKTNFGEAIFDITSMLLGTVSEKPIWKNLGFINANSNKEKKIARFEYIFQIDGCEIEYVYEKYSVYEINFESLKIDQKLLYELNFTTGYSNFSSFKNYAELSTLNLGNWDKKVSVLRYMLGHTKLVSLGVLKKIETFILEMHNSEIIFRSQSQKFDNRPIDADIKSIIELELVDDFQLFLQEAGINVILRVEPTPEGVRELYFDYGSKVLRFIDYASSGTLSLVGLYSALMLSSSGSEITFLYIDEFDANFHFELAKKMLEKFKQNPNCQTVITTHNTDLMSNKYLRPDCYLLMSPNKIVNLADATRRKVREGHDLEILYQSGGLELLNQEVMNMAL